MWTVETTSVSEGVVNAVATHESGFSWSATIKVTDTQAFVDRAKDELQKYQNLHQNDESVGTTLENLLNN